ncbi:MAG: hypothetical protein AAFY60_00675, partial [Myxococcota bacterium]
LGLGLAGAAVGAGIARAVTDDISDENLNLAANTGILASNLLASRRTIRWVCASSASAHTLPKAPAPFDVAASTPTSR